jgi:hypothetical protein
MNCAAAGGEDAVPAKSFRNGDVDAFASRATNPEANMASAKTDKFLSILILQGSLSIYADVAAIGLFSINNPINQTVWAAPVQLVF